jgi:hypothetical protein
MPFAPLGAKIKKIMLSIKRCAKKEVVGFQRGARPWK